MRGPASAGVFLYASHVPTLAQFYQALLDMEVRVSTDQKAILQVPGLQLVIHAFDPAVHASVPAITTPPQVRETAIRFFFTVACLDLARAQARLLGGDIEAQRYAGPGFVMCNGFDPEGNRFQVRELTPAS